MSSRPRVDEDGGRKWEGPEERQAARAETLTGIQTYNLTKNRRNDGHKFTVEMLRMVWLSKFLTLFWEVLTFSNGESALNHTSDIFVLCGF